MKRTNTIICNVIRCKLCKAEIESKHVHDFKYCPCKAVAVDGGKEYLKRIGSEENFEELSVVIKG